MRVFPGGGRIFTFFFPTANPTSYLLVGLLADLSLLFMYQDSCLVMAEQSSRDAVNQTQPGGQQSSDPVSTDGAATTPAPSGKPAAQAEDQKGSDKQENTQSTNVTEEGAGSSPTTEKHVDSNTTTSTADTSKSESSSTVGTPFLVVVFVIGLNTDAVFSSLLRM